MSDLALFDEQDVANVLLIVATAELGPGWGSSPDWCFAVSASTLSIFWGEIYAFIS